MNDTILYTKALAVGYGRKIIADGIELSVDRGEILTLIGPNGAGKSTVLKSIINQLKIISGDVFANDKSIKNISGNELAKTMSVLMTERVNPELMTCREMIESGRYPYTGQFGILSPYDKKKVNEAIELTHISEIADEYFSRISDGQKQKVMLSRALCQEPDIMVLDEPSSFLDIQHKLEMLNIIRHLVREKKIGVIMSMHELDLAERISDKVVCIKNGKIDRYGSPDEIFTKEYISSLYGISAGSYEENYGSAELRRPEGVPETFVIAGGNSGIKVFRALARKNIPFFAGVIHESDIDYPAAAALAREVVSEKPFERISEVSVKRAMEKIEACKNVICAVKHFGEMNAGNKTLAEFAEKKGILRLS